MSACLSGFSSLVFGTFSSLRVSGSAVRAQSAEERDLETVIATGLCAPRCSSFLGHTGCNPTTDNKSLFDERNCWGKKKKRRKKKKKKCCLAFPPVKS
ncbi:unnamed protein product [Gadus morhua 'NCC']